MEQTQPRPLTVVIFLKCWSRDVEAIERECLALGWTLVPGTPEDHKITVVKKPGAKPEAIVVALDDDVVRVMNAFEDKGWKIQYRISPALEFNVPEGTQESCAARMRKDPRVADAKVFDPDATW